jgi:hypothetical protein
VRGSEAKEKALGALYSDSVRVRQRTFLSEGGRFTTDPPTRRGTDEKARFRLSGPAFLFSSAQSIAQSQPGLRGAGQRPLPAGRLELSGWHGDGVGSLLDGGAPAVLLWSRTMRV